MRRRFFSRCAVSFLEELNRKMNAIRGALFAIVVLLCFGLSGCGGPAKAPAGGTGTAANGSEDTLARIKREGVLRWGADPNGGGPFVYMADDGKTVIGFEMEVMELFAKHMGVKPELVASDWDALIDTLQSRRTDMVMNGIEINEDRAKVVGFSEPYYLYEQQLTVRIEDKDKYKTLDDLKGKPVGTLKAAEANNVLTRAGWSEENIKPYPDSLTPYTDLKLKRTEAVLQESIIAAHYAGKDEKLLNNPNTFSPGKYAVAVRAQDKTLLGEVNRILDLMKKNGELAAIYAKWNIMNDKQKELGVEAKN